LIACKLARNNKFDEDPRAPRHVRRFAGSLYILPNEQKSAHDSDRTEFAPKRALAEVSRDHFMEAQASADDCRARADVCLVWAREACSDPVRLACLTLASAWLKAATDRDTSAQLPLAPRLDV
jgi:hypothetical protein